MPQIVDRLPDKDDETFKFPKSYVCNLIYTCVGDDFKSWVKQQIIDRNEKVAKDQNLNIDVDRDIAEAFHRSNAVST